MRVEKGRSSQKHKNSKRNKKNKMKAKLMNNLDEIRRLKWKVYL